MCTRTRERTADRRRGEREGKEARKQGSKGSKERRKDGWMDGAAVLISRQVLEPRCRRVGK